jgi:hypothetical protein
MIKSRSLVTVGAIACFVACAGDFLVVFIFGSYYPGYNQLINTMSSLGASASPVSGIVSLCWIVLGFIFILFAIGFREHFSTGGKSARLAFWLLVIYGTGELMGSGVFKADHSGNTISDSAIIHGLLGSIGIAALFILPLIMTKIIPRSSNPGFYIYSRFVVSTGFVLLVFFNYRFTQSGANFIEKYEGLWQRLFVMDYYIFLMIIAGKMLRKQYAIGNTLTDEHETN